MTGYPLFGRRPWTAEEDVVIRNIYLPTRPGDRFAACASLLPDRTKDAIRSRARNMKRGTIGRKRMKDIVPWAYLEAM